MPAAQIFIKGQIGIPFFDEFGVEGTYTTLTDIIAQAEAQSEADSIDLFIGHSPGGSVNEGDLAIEYLDGLGKPINTFTFGPVGSYATKFFSMGKNRTISDGHDFIIHNPWNTGVPGDANIQQENVDELREFEKATRKFYSERTGVSEDALKPLLDQETSIPADSLKKLGIATAVIKLDAVKDKALSAQADKALSKLERIAAVVKFKKHSKPDKTMSNENKGLFASLEAKIDKFLSKDKTVYNLERKLEGGENSIFIEAEDILTEAWTGAKALSVDAEGNQVTAEDGVYVLEDGTKLKVTNGEIISVDQKQVETAEKITRKDLEQLTAKILTAVEKKFQSAPNPKVIISDIKKELFPDYKPKTESNSFVNKDGVIENPSKQVRQYLLDQRKVRKEQHAKTYGTRN